VLNRSTCCPIVKADHAQPGTFAQTSDAALAQRRYRSAEPTHCDLR
jgi:hypothetical protein